MTTDTGTDDVLAALALGGPLRPYQQLAIDAFERDRAAGRTGTHIVAPPGSGKTVVGLEIVRRLGRPALVLAPTATIQAQWGEKLALFTADPAAVLAPAGPLHVLTYQAICQTADPDGALRDAAIARLTAERARTTAQSPEVAAAELAGLTGTARDRHERDVAAAIAGLKREVARGEGLEALVAPAARARLDALRRAGVGTLVLDECHHLASMWGYLVRALVAALGDVHVVGLTATSPADLRGDEAALYAELLGPVDFEISTPAVVRDGHLAPYQELAFFTTPLASERDWLAERHVRFDELLDRLHEPAPADEEDLAFAPWVIGRIRHRDTGDGTARVPFSTLAARRPDLARAGLRYLGGAGLALPDDAPRGEGWREPLTLDDWLVLIGDYAASCLRTHPGDAAERRLEELQVGLRDLGFTLTRQGVRRGGSDVDRVLMQSAAKPIGAIEILAAEAEARGDDIRVVVLCDTEHPAARPEGSALALTGGARGVVRALGEDVRSAVLRPLLVTGQGVACLPGDADVLAAALGASERVERAGLVELGAPGWDSRAWVAAAGRALAAGTTRLVVGTRGLLGEGWDAPALNVLVDLTSVAADISVRQMRGRTLRLDPADGTKIASNWDVVCVAADLARGTADYERFARRHAHLRAPCEDGSIESGVSHVHGALSPFVPPPDAEHASLNGEGLRRAAAHHEAWSRWRIGEPYVGEDVPVLLVRAAGARRAGGGGGEGTFAAAEALLAGTGLDDGPTAGAPPRPGGPLAALRLGALARAYPAVLPLPRVARAVVAAYASLGELSAAAAASLVIVPRPGGLVRCALSDGNALENQRFAGALEEALSPAFGHRYVVGRPVWPEGRGRGGVAWRALTFRAPLDVAWHPVPSDLGSHKERATAYLGAWTAHVGPGELLFAGREGAAGRASLTASAASAAPYVTSRRRLWH